MSPRAVAVGDRVTIAKNLPVTPWVDANELERAVIGGDHRKAAAVGTVEYLTRGPKGLFSVEVRHDDGNLAPYLANEITPASQASDQLPRGSWRRWAVEVWNRRVPVGAPVALTEDDGSITDTATCSEAWQLGDGTPVVKVDGRAGGYLLRRVRPTGQLRTAKDQASLVQRMRDCLLELAGEPEESETIPELIQRVRETVRRPAQIAMDLAKLEPEQLADIASGMQSLGADAHTAAGQVVAALEELAMDESGGGGCKQDRPLYNCAAAPGGDCDGCDDEHPGGPGQRGAEIRRQAKRGAIAEQLWEACDAWERAMSSKHVREDRPALVRASQALVAVIQQIRRHLRHHPDGRIEHVTRLDRFPSPWHDVLTKLAPGLGDASLKEQAEEVRRRFALLAQEWQAVAAMTAEWREDSVLGGHARALWYAHQRARQAVEGISLGDVQPSLREAGDPTDEAARWGPNDFAIALGVEKWDRPRELVAAAEKLVNAHHSLVHNIAHVAAVIAGVTELSAKLWRKKALYHHLEAVQRDLQRAVETAEKGGVACPD